MNLKEQCIEANFIQRPKSERVVYLDLMRIVSIFAMMLLHVAASNWNSQSVDSFNWQVFNVYDSLARFCVPVFVMISGTLFLNPTKQYSFQKLFKHNILRVITAFVFWSACYAVIGGIFMYKVINAESINYVLESFVLGHFHLWFLFTLVGLYLIVPFLRKITADKKLCEYYLILFLIFGIVISFLSGIPELSNINLLTTNINLNFVLGYSGYFVLGYYLYKYDISDFVEKLIYVFGIIAIVATILLSYYSSIKLGQPNDYYYKYLSPNVLLTSIAVYVLFKKRVSKLKLNDKLSARVFQISKLSFGMYLVHDFINIFFRKFLNLTTISFNPLLSVPVITVLVFIISFVITYFLSKIPVLNKYIM